MTGGVKKENGRDALIRVFIAIVAKKLCEKFAQFKQMQYFCTAIGRDKSQFVGFHEQKKDGSVAQLDRATPF